MNDKVKAIVAHITIVGWLIALIINITQGKTPLTTFYLRQMLGLIAIILVSSFFPKLLGTIISLIVLGLWIYSLIGAVQNERREVPWIGGYFQKWFDFI